MSEIQALVFPRPAFGTPEASAWASLHGFDHASVIVQPDVVVVEHRPRGIFDPTSFHRGLLSPDDDVRVVLGRVIRGYAPASSRLSYLDTREDRERYEQLSAKLRRRAIIGDTRVSLTSGATSSENADLARWYWSWFEATHEGAGDSEIATADAIRHGLCQASREHALDFVGKLGYVNG